jgi:glycosyltransferase involved in cell wall biosynthesis
MGVNYPKISIVTPSFNSSKYIKFTVDSVLSQNYPSLEYIIFDAKSTDGTIDILKEYNDSIIWVSEKDNGQSDAINKGFMRSSGDIVAWINSNDIYLSNCFFKVAKIFKDHPDVDFIFAEAILINESGDKIGNYSEGGNIETKLKMNTVFNGHLNKLLNTSAGWIPQQTTFWRRYIFDKVGYLDPSLHYAMDYDYWLRIGKQSKILYVNDTFAAYRKHDDAKSSRAKEHWIEVLQIQQKYGGKVFSLLTIKFLNVVINSLKKRMLKLIKFK